MVYSPNHRDSPEDIIEQKTIIARTNYSASVLGMGCVYRGSGEFLNIRSPKEPPRNPKIKHIDDTV